MARGRAAAEKKLQTAEDIFALDIGTRNVVGIIGRMEDGVFHVLESASAPHKRRAMIDGQIEDIEEAAKVVKEVKEELESKTGMTLTHVAIAAAGRALITKRSTVENDIEGKDRITDEMIKSLEIEAVLAAQSELDSDDSEGTISFYCVGHSVIDYKLDGYPIKNLQGHKGKKASVELIAAFLPSVVVESLYSVMDMNDLEVSALTLEPIAAMNIIIPPEVRLINIALADIGAGTTDIAISKNGTIVAYAMATTAGDEITEDIIQKYLVDFETAEAMKLTPVGEDVVFTDILGFEHTIESKEFYPSLFPAVEQLADTIAANIVKANGSAPAAVFLVGGGSLIPELSSLVADKLDLPATRVAIGGQRLPKTVLSKGPVISGPEYVTPLGIGLTATHQTAYDFSTITLNDRKIRIFDTKSVTAADLLMNAGYKTPQIIGRSGRSLTFTLNGEKQNFRGEPAIPAEIKINGQSVSLEHTIMHGDVIEFKPAVPGENASVKVGEIAGLISNRRVVVDGLEYFFGTTVRANDSLVSKDYSIQNYDSITVESIETLGDLVMSLPFDCERLFFYKNGKLLRDDYILCDNDILSTSESIADRTDESPNMARDFFEKSTRHAVQEEPQFENIFMTPSFKEAVSEKKPEQSEEEAPPVQEKVGDITVILNSRPTVLKANNDGSPHVFLELMALVDIDTKNPPPGANMILTVNGRDASFMEPLKEGDEAVIRWA